MLYLNRIFQWNVYLINNVKLLIILNKKNNEQLWFNREKKYLISTVIERKLQETSSLRLKCFAIESTWDGAIVTNVREIDLFLNYFPFRMIIF